jgi:shikimate kinase
MGIAESLTDRNLVLTGFMGTGKTTIGKMVAAELGWFFVDSDALIAKRFGPVEEIFDSHGEDHFRELERQIADELAEGSGQVIATGGALILDPKSSAVLNRTGRTFCLVARPETIFKRLGGNPGAKRPLLVGDDPKGRIRDLLDERSDGYGAFPQFSTETSTMSNIASELAELISAPIENLIGPNGGSWWIGPGIMGSAASLAGHFGPVVAVVDKDSDRYGPVTGANEILVVEGIKPLDRIRTKLADADDGSVVVVVGGEKVMSLGVMAAESTELPVVLCPTGADGVEGAIELGAATPPGHTVVLELGTLQSGNPSYVEPLTELWDSVAVRLLAED